jgi:3-deoxy-D-manno-octulosonic-acid transferase
MVGALLPYRAALWITSPLLLGYTLRRAARDGGALYLRQRLGAQMPELDAPLWIHCASVGEVNAALPLLKAIRARHPRLALLVTTNTPTGRATLLSRMNHEVTHSFLPLDFGFSISRFLQRLRPRCGLVMETELWPNLYEQCAASGIPLVLVNARLSERTLKAPAPMRAAYRHALSKVTAILAKSNADAGRFLSLGAPRERVETLGNIKFAAPTPNTPRAWPDLVGRPYWLAASTHHDEELRIARIWRHLSGNGQVLVIAPRHPERRVAILKQLRPLGLATAVRSRGDAVTSHTRVYLADTVGELDALMAHATLVFMGGSMVRRGGHNILEPARLGKAILVGPHMDNFADEARALLATEAIFMVQDDRELGYALERLQADADLRAALGRRAASFMTQQADIAQVYVQRLEPLCGLQ